MKVDKRYETLPVLRRTVKTLSPFWFLLLAFKVSFIGAPERIAPQAGDPISFTIFGAAALISVFTWMLAAIGGKSERFPAVMAFNVFTVVTIFLVSQLPHNLAVIGSMLLQVYWSCLVSDLTQMVLSSMLHVCSTW